MLAAALMAVIPLDQDWLVHAPTGPAEVSRTGRTLTLGNGLASRTWHVREGETAATISLICGGSGEEFVRAVQPEAIVTLNGEEHLVGGLADQPNRAYLRADWIEQMPAAESAFRLTRVEDAAISEPRMPWGRPRRHQDLPWPPPGRRLDFTYESPLAAVVVSYELYDGAPIFAKSLRVTAKEAVKVDRFVAESIAFAEPESSVDSQERWRRPNWTLLTDYSFGGMSPNDEKIVRYRPDPEYATQVNYARTMPALVEAEPPLGPGVTLEPGESLGSFTVFGLLHDSTDRERQSLGIRRMYRMLAPWTTESPLMLHLTSTDPATVRTAIDQAAECGYEMVILSFGSGLNMEDTSPENIAKFKGFADYAHSKGLEFGGYSLLASRSISPEHDAINPETGKPGGMRFGSSPCLLSEWGIGYFDRIKTFMTETGFDLLEHDGSYPGDVCASTSHPGHEGLHDSQWRQFAKIADFYNWCRAEGIYLNVPDSYFFQGSNKTGMGYRETNWSLPREQQHIHARQNLYDGTWQKPPTMGWMFVPLVQYHGGGAAATTEPLKEHLDDYRQHLYNNLGYGAQACYRGPRLYDSPETKAVVIEAVQWFKRHRDILESDVIHIRRPDGRRVDAIMHVNPSLETPALLMAYNPTDQDQSEAFALPMRYAGLDGRVSYSLDGEAYLPTSVRNGVCWITVKVPANGHAAVHFKRG